MEPVYIALGSHSTHGAGASRPEHTGYVAVLGRFLERHDPALQLLSSAAWGEQLGDFVERWPQISAAEPSVITVLPISDFARTPMPDFKERCAELLNQIAPYAAAHPDFRLFFGDLRIDPAYLRRPELEVPGYHPKEFAMLTEKNAALADAAARHPWVELVPVFDQNAVHPEWTGEGGHPNDLGHGYLAGCFRGAMERWLAE